jgi:hypothetical protein
LGFPTGRQLLLQIVNGLYAGNSQLVGTLHALGFDAEELASFEQDLRLSMRSSVDAFLEQRPEYREVGKAAIAASLIPYETMGSLQARTQTTSWYEYLYHQMAQGAGIEQFGLNRISVVTLNYDRSLERFLLGALAHTYGVTNDVAAHKIRAMSIFHHLYGQLGSPLFLEPNARSGRDYSPDVTVESVKACLSQIWVLPEHPPGMKALKAGRMLIEQAEVVALLGFGYDPLNVTRLGLDRVDEHKFVIGTCYHLDADEQQRVWELCGVRIQLGRESEDCLALLRGHPILR